MSIFKFLNTSFKQTLQTISYPSVLSSPPTATIVFPVMFNSENTIVSSATCGCRMRNVPTIVQTVAFAALVVLKTSSTAMIVACALIALSMTTTIVRMASTSQTVPSVRNISSRRVQQVMKCPVDMRFIGIVFGSWRPMILVALFVRRRQKPGNV